MQPTNNLLVWADVIEKSARAKETGLTKEATQRKLKALFSMVQNAVRSGTHEVSPIKQLARTISRRSEDQIDHINEMLVNARNTTINPNKLVKRMFQAHHALNNRNNLLANTIGAGYVNPSVFNKITLNLPTFS